jgi:hypothetical protein
LKETTSFGAAVCAIEGKTKGEIDFQWWIKKKSKNN